MKFLTDEMISGFLPAETSSFPSPVPTQIVSSDEYPPVPQTAKQREVEGRLIDFKTASRRPSSVSPDYAFQLATYQQITPGASGEVRIDSLVKTQTVQIVQQAYTVEEPDIKATQVLYPMAQKAMGSGMYCPNRQSMLCSHKHCSFATQCQEEFGGRVRSS